MNFFQHGPYTIKNIKCRFTRGQTEEELQCHSLHNENNNHTKLIRMRWQKIMSQMKEQDKTPEKQLNELEICNFPEKEFRMMIVKMIQDLGKITEKMQDMVTKT